MVGRFISAHSVTLVLLMHVSHTPVRGGSVHADVVSSRLGGGFMTLPAAVAQGVPAVLASPLGAGPNSFAVHQQFIGAGVEILTQELVGDIGVAIQLIERNGSMTFIVAAGAEPEPSWTALDRMVLRSGDLIHIAALDLTIPHSAMVLADWGAVLPASVRPVVSVSPAVEQVPVGSWRQLLKRADIVTMNVRETVAFSSILATYEPGTGIHNLTKSEATLVRRTGIMGCELQCEQGAERTQVPAFETRVMNTAGVGDTHIVIMCAALLKGKDIEEACSLTGVAAAIAISHESALPVSTLEQILRTVKEGKAMGPTSQKV